MIRLIIDTPGTFPSPRDSRLEQAYASPVVLKEKGTESENIQRHERKKRFPRALHNEDGKLGDDGRKRRHRGSSDDEAYLTADVSLISDLRVGGTYLCTVPIKTYQIPASNPLTAHLDPWVGQIRQSVQTILQENDADTIELSFVLRQSEWIPEEKPIPTVLILAQRHEVDDRWLHAAREIRDFLTRLIFKIFPWKLRTRKFSNH